MLHHQITKTMDGLLDFLHDLLPISWFEHTHATFGLSDNEIVQSVQDASAFFNMEPPEIIREDWATGVMTGMPSTVQDDILIFNRDEMHNMGINDKEGFDLIMTHEGAHRALQGKDLSFSEHQEELCCDYMAGVRAGLNHMDESKIVSALSDTIESTTHPDGALRAQAVEQGVVFAHEYMEKHNGTPPSFSDCLEDFELSDVYIKTVIDEFKDPDPDTDPDPNNPKKPPIIKHVKMCPTRHGCQGATYCDYCGSDYPG